MTATAMPLSWLQQEQAVDSTMRGAGGEKEAMMMAVARLSRKGRWWGVRDNDDGKEEVVEVDDNDEAVTALGGGGRQKSEFEESSRRTARPTAPMVPTGMVTTKSTKTRHSPPRHRIVGDGGIDCRDNDGGHGGGGVGGSDNDTLTTTSMPEAV